MRDLGWPVGLIVAFGLGAAAGGWLGRGPFAAEEVERLREAERRLQSQVTALWTRLGAGAAGPGGQTDAPGRAASRARAAGTTLSTDGSVTAGTVQAYTRHILVQREELRAGSASAQRLTAAARSTPEAALDRFYLYLEEMNGAGGLARWQRMQELTDELRRMGPAGVDALMRVLGSAASADERRAAAQLLGELQAVAAVPLLQEILEQESDLALRRAAVAGLRRIDAGDAIPVLEGLLLNPAEDRFIRMSAATGLAQMGRSQGVAALMQVFEESGLDSRGRDMAFRALMSLHDERAMPFMRRLVTSDAEARYRLRAMRFLSTQSDRQALPSLQQIMQSPTEHASLKTAAAQAHAAIAGR